MRSVIKQCQYNGVLPSAQQHNSQITSPYESQPEIKNADERSHVKGAFEKAKKIIDAANQYSSNHIRETSERIDMEMLAIREKSKADGYEEGYVAGCEQGEKAGYADGYDEGMRTALENNKKNSENLIQIFKSLEDIREDIIDRQNTQMVDLALEIAQSILQEELTANPTAVASIIEKTIENYKNLEWINVHISQNIYDYFTETDNNFLEKIRSYSEGIHLKPSIELNDLDCLVELPAQLVDASADTQMSKIKAVLKRR